MAGWAAPWHGEPMLGSGSSRLALLTVVAALAAAASTAPAASAATQRYASPTGFGTDCSAAVPCAITEAVTGTGAGSEVILDQGNYSLTQTLIVPADVTIHGVAGEPRPRLLFSGAGQSGLRLEHGSTLRYARIHQSGPAFAVTALGASVDQVIANAPDFTLFTRNGVIRNSIVVATASKGHAISTNADDITSLVTLRNVTAIAPASGGVAIRAEASGSVGYVGMLVRNVIARGGPNGLSFDALADLGTTAKITVDHSNWEGGGTGGAGASIVDGGENQSSAPVFVDAGADDYRQAPGSPTIDAGLSEFIDGPLDVDGDPRQVGYIDIGADEYVAVPAATTGPASAVGDHSATLSGSVDPHGASSAYQFEYGLTTAYGKTTLSAGAGSAGAVAATAAIAGLSPATTYHYRLVAFNSAYVTKGADRTFTTAPAPQPAPTSPAPTPTTAFAGVKLLSTRLAFGGRFITLKLSCPSATADRCSGRTKLAARRRTSSGAVRAVVLGRAPFSIAAGTEAKVRVRVSRAGRRLLGRVRRLRGKDTSAARDGAGQSRTTVAGVTIRRRHRI